jgi:thymidylate synthase (FAD)
MMTDQGVLEPNLAKERPFSPFLDTILNEPMEVLDHGYLRVVDYMGTEQSIIDAARVSYGIGTSRGTEDAKLLRYLLRHWHSTPFEMCEIKFHVKMPIFVARQWIRHRTANVNEYSGRYSVMDKEFYLPQAEHLAAQSTLNNQGREKVLTLEESRRVLQLLKEDATNAYAHYLEMLNSDEEGNLLDPSKDGLARELARMNLSLNFYTQMYWKIDVHNWMHFLRLRADSHAQYEIRVYAEKMLLILKGWLPNVAGAFVDYRLESVNLSRQEKQVVTQLIADRGVEARSLLELSDIKGREKNEFLTKFKLM